MPDRAVGVDHRIGTQVDVGRGELFDQRAQQDVVPLGQPRDLVAELEAVEDVLDAGGEPVEEVLEVGSQLLAAGPGAEVVEGELRGVIEGLAGRLPERCFLLDDSLLVEPSLHVEDGLLGGFQDRVEAAQHGHGEDDIAVFAADVDVAEDIVGDAPDVVGDPVEVWGGGFGHFWVMGLLPALSPSAPPQNDYTTMGGGLHGFVRRQASRVPSLNHGIGRATPLVRHFDPVLADKLVSSSSQQRTEPRPATPLRPPAGWPRTLGHHADMSEWRLSIRQSEVVLLRWTVRGQS